MARVRDLNPGFFLDDVLAELSPLHRLLFEGLWCLADREGRLEDRPRRIKPQVLPYDDADVDAMLGDLHDAEFIYRYEADGRRCIGIPKFKRYQRVHHKEAQSVLPPCLDQAWVKLEASTGQVWGKQESSMRTGTGTGTVNRRRGRGAQAPAPPAPVDKSALCPGCETEVTYDEHGAHCPVCEWRAS